MNKSETKLYDTDFYQWVIQTVKLLKSQNFEAVDWDNLIEEFESMGKSEKRALISLLTRLLEHLLKLSYWEAEKERCRNHWAAEIVNFRSQISDRLQDSPSLKKELPAIYEKVYPIAVKSVSQLFKLPSSAYISLENALNEDWFND